MAESGEDDRSSSSGRTRSKAIYSMNWKRKPSLRRQTENEAQQRRSSVVKYPVSIACSRVWAMACCIASCRLFDCCPWPRIPGASPSHWNVASQTHRNRLTRPVNLPKHFTSHISIDCSSSQLNFSQIIVLRYSAHSFQRPVRRPSSQTSGTSGSSAELCSRWMNMRRRVSCIQRVCMIDCWTGNREKIRDPITFLYFWSLSNGHGVRSLLAERDLT